MSLALGRPGPSTVADGAMQAVGRVGCGDAPEMVALNLPKPCGTPPRRSKLSIIRNLLLGDHGMLLRTFKGRSKQVMTTSVNPDHMKRQQEQLSDTAQKFRAATVAVPRGTEPVASTGG